MSSGKAFLLALFLVLPGVALRVAPYADRLAAPRSERPAETPRLEAERISVLDFSSTPSRLSERRLAHLVGGFALEVSIYLLVLTFLLRSRRFVGLLSTVSPAQQGFRVVFFSTLVAGFLAGSPESFPFVAWRMYTGMAEEPPSTYLVNGTTRGGSSVRLDFRRILPMLGEHRGYGLVAVRAAALESAHAEHDRGELMTALRTVGQLYNLRNPQDPLVRLWISSVSIPLETREPPWVRDERTVAEVELE